MNFEKGKIRLKRIKIENIKNTEFGEIKLFKKNKEVNEGNIIGIYGQNGSGKTSSIESLKIIKDLFMGLQLNDKSIGLIKQGSNFGSIEVEFVLIDIVEKIELEIIYVVDLSIEEKKNILAGELSGNKIVLDREVLKIRDKNDKNRLEKILELSIINNKIEISPKKYRKFVNDEIVNMLFKENCKSYIFADSTFGKMKLSELLLNEYKYDVIGCLKGYAIKYLSIYTNDNNAISTLNMILPISVHGMEAHGSIAIRLNEPSVLDVEIFNILKNMIDKMNIVLPNIVPNLKLEIKNYGKEFDSDSADKKVRFDILSVRGNIKIPVRQESEGIKKIISILSSLIAAYNDPKITVAIDELDSGIFEYLLGELLLVFKDNLKGQLIFTSHNLRVLEVLDNKSIYYTTTDEKNRFIPMKSSKPTSNNRDIYLREIYLGSSNPELYDKTEMSEIRYGFKEANYLNDRK